MVRSWRWVVFSSLAAAVAMLAAASGVMPATGRAQGPGEGKTLREVLAAEKLPLDAEALRNLDAKISSGAELNDEAQFVIAYYLLDSTGLLKPPIFIVQYDRRTQRWKS